ncbi:MAG: PHP domain-containing protein [Clostridia bacterium]|nr:PHP domain-containing protein [Clostridia bacterium]
MKYYKYETHLHTSEVSACARASAAEQVEFYAESGYAGIIVTDHFLNGNTTVPREGLTWKEKIEKFCEGYVNALREGKKVGLDVFFGWEASYGGTDFLTYGLSPSWLLKNEQIMDLPYWEYLDYVRDEGGLIVHAHPFREAAYIKGGIKLMPRKVDAIEIINANRTEFENRMAKEFAKNYGLAPFAGSDNHSAYAQKKLAGIKTKERIENIIDFIDIIQCGEYKIFSE